MISDEENQRLMDELGERLTKICQEYDLSQVSSATFTIMMIAINENPVAVERLHAMNTVIHQVQEEYNALLRETRRPAKSNLH